MEKHYYDEALDLDGTADELFNQTRYIESHEAMRKIETWLREEGKLEKARAVAAYDERLDDLEDDIPFGGMKSDICDGYKGVIADDVVYGESDEGPIIFSAELDRDEEFITFWVHSEKSIGTFKLEVQKFMDMSRKDFISQVNAAWFYATPVE